MAQHERQPKSGSAVGARDAAFAAAIVLLGLFAYSNSLSGDFVFDDLPQIRDNPAIRRLGSYLWSTEGYRSLPNRFVAYATFAMNYRLGGLDTRGFHAVNLAIHLANSLLLFWLAVLCFRAPRVRESVLAPLSRPMAFLAAASFATHPLGTQAVTYIVQRVTSLAALLYVLAVVLYLAWRLQGRERSALSRGATYAGVLLAALLAFRTKEMTFTLPLALLLAEALLLEPAGWRRFLPVLPIALLALVIPATVLLQAGAAPSALARIGAATRVDSTLGRMDYLRTQFVVLADYLRLLAVPTGQNLDHDVAVRHTLLDPSVAASAAILAMLAGTGLWLAWRSRRRAAAPVDPVARVAAFGIGWFFLASSVESSVLPIVDLMYEHRAYLPSVGLFLTFAVGAASLARMASPAAAARITVLAGMALAFLLSSATLQRNVVWRDELTMWTDSAGKSPNRFRPWFNLGTVLAGRGDLPAAVAALERALAINPGHGSARAQLGAALLQSGRPRDAERELRLALKERPDDPEVLFNLGTLLARTGGADEGHALLRRYLEIAPAGQVQGRKAASAVLAR